MAKNREKLAALFGAKIVAEVPDVGCGAFGMARLTHLLHRRLTPSQDERPGGGALLTPLFGGHTVKAASQRREHGDGYA